MNRLVPILAASLLGSCTNQPAPEAVQVKNVWVRIAPVAGRPSGLYFVMRGGRENDRLIAISSPDAQRIELHDSRMEGGMMRMTPLSRIDIPAGGEVTFSPAGKHGMVFGLESVRAGERLRLRFTFASGARVDADALGIAAGWPEPQFVDPPSRPGTAPCEPGVRREGDTIIATNCGP